MGLIFGTLLTVLSIFLILLVLVQRGRGGGLTGALGGMGGSSAFGAKAGDIFTRITIVTAGVWIVVCAMSVYWANNRSDRLGSTFSTGSTTLPSAPAGPSMEMPAPKTGETAPADTKGSETSAAAPAASTSPAPSTPAPAASTPAPSTPAPTTPQ